MPQAEEADDTSDNRQTTLSMNRVSVVIVVCFLRLVLAAKERGGDLMVNL
jgi:hypothetical protein